MTHCIIATNADINSKFQIKNKHFKALVMFKLLSFFLVIFLLASCAQKLTQNESEKALPFNLESAKKSFTEYKNVIDKAKDKNKLNQKLREDIVFTKFNNENIEISEAELWYEGQNIVRIDVRYYDGAPMGTKHWYIKNLKPIGVSVAQFIQKEDDTIGERLLYEMVYDQNGSKWLNTDAKSKYTYSEETITEWEILKNIAEKYKPKADNEKD
jgi:hypothetical protein